MEENNSTSLQTESPSQKKTNILIFIIPIIIVLFAVAVYFVYTNMSNSSHKMSENTVKEEQNETLDQETTDTTPSNNTITDENNEYVMGESDEVITYTVTGGNFYFEPQTLTANKGDKIKIVFNNVEGTHDWVLDEFQAETDIIQTGQTAIVEFTADESGIFEYYCSIGNHKAMGMVGTLIVN